MPSILPGFEYDVFISYRHNDNRSGWVTEFVKNLQEELAATIKDPVSVYFDSNPYDGLLETHDVDKSLQNKLKTLVFIPILSQTYCDTKCFAWQHEFIVFNKLAKEDQFGRDIRLVNGNVSSRILPVKIHDLDPDDKTILESELGSVLRSIDFTFKSPGVNRPLTSTDKREENANKTFYRDQVNKVANAIKEIISAIIHTDNSTHEPSKKSNDQPLLQQRPKSPPKRLIAVLMALVAVVALLYFLRPHKRPGKKDFISSSVDKSVAVLPFVNISDDKEQEYFSDGLTEEIINRLAGLPQLKVMARTSSFSFKGKNLPIQKIADSLGVSYVVEGSVRRAEKKIKVSVQLIRSSDGTHIWSKTYDQVLEDIFRIQEDIASNVARTLDIYLDEGKKEMMLYLGTRNVDAYENFLKGKAEFKRAHSPIGGSLWKANIFFERALAYDSAFSTAYWYQSDAYLHSLFAGSDILFATEDAGGFSPSEAYTKMNFLINRAIQYSSDTSIRNLYSLTKIFYSENWTDLPVYVNKFIHNEEAPKVMSYTETALGTYSLILAGKGAELYRICNEAVNYDPLQHLIWEKGIYGALSEGMLTDAAEFDSRGKQATGENHSEILALSLALGYKKEITARNFSRSQKAIALSRDGQSARALAIADSLFLANPANESLIWLYHELKNREKANMIANEIDKKELGSLKLAMLLTTTNNLDPVIFDLKSTPNFAKRLQEAGIALKSSTDLK